MKTAPILSLSEFEKKAWAYYHVRTVKFRNWVEVHAEGVHQYNALLSRLGKKEDVVRLEASDFDYDDYMATDKFERFQESWNPLLILNNNDPNTNAYYLDIVGNPISEVRKDMWYFNIDHPDLPDNYLEIANTEI